MRHEAHRPQVFSGLRGRVNAVRAEVHGDLYITRLHMKLLLSLTCLRPRGTPLLGLHLCGFHCLRRRCHPALPVLELCTNASL